MLNRLLFLAFALCLLGGCCGPRAVQRPAPPPGVVPCPPAAGPAAPAFAPPGVTPAPLQSSPVGPGPGAPF
jgi:hypothetical protein